MLGVKEFAGLGLKGLASDSRKVKPGYLFAALSGTKTDGARFVKDAVARGAVAVLGAPALADDVAALGVRFIADENPRAGLAHLASLFFTGQPEIVAAVTGTKGKSSIVAFLREIWTALGRPAASLGTVGVIGPKGEMPLSHTTPDPVEIHELLARLKQDGVDHLAIEASSHGLDQHRLDWREDIRLRVHQHHPRPYGLSSHFRGLPHRQAAPVHRSGEGGRRRGGQCRRRARRSLHRRRERRGLRLVTVGRKGHTIRLDRREDRGGAQALTLHYHGRIFYIELPQAGEFQASNALVAAGLAIGLGEDAAKVFKALESLKGAPGRMEKVAFAANGAPVYVDYAHTPDSLEKVLEALRPHTGNRLHVVFGCGGDRDKGKRPLMGAIAVKLADDVIVTDDNPRTEDPAAIRREILAAAPGAREIGDRAQAIRAAVAELKTGDVLVLAGKGHETGQYINGEVHPFSDREQAIAAAVALGGRAA